MKHKKFEAVLYSSIGVLVMLAIVAGINVLVAGVNVRVDMTEDKLFTLSDGTKQILGGLDTPVEVRYYFSRSHKNLPSWVSTFAGNVEDLLAELDNQANGRLVIKKIDPKPDSDAEDQAIKDGIEQQMSEIGEPYFLGVAISMDPYKVALPVLSPSRERLLEYDLARAIAQVQNATKPVVGVMTPMPMFGEEFNPMMMQMGRRPAPAWAAITELKRDFDVRQIPMDAEEIDPEVKVLIVVQPRGITDKAQFAIDQFVLRGGKLLAMLDAMSLVDRPQSDNPVQQMLPGGGSNMENLLKAWGIEFDSSKVVADMSFAKEIQQSPQQPPQLAPTILFMDEQGINHDDIATGEINNVWLLSPGHFRGTPSDGLKQTILLHSSKQSELVDGMTAQFNSAKIVSDFKPSGTEYTLALRLHGKFKTAFPGGRPGQGEKGGEEGANKGGNAEFLKESRDESVVVLVGDSDMIFDNFCVEKNFGFFRPLNGNLNLFQNIVEQLGGDSRLIGVRSRATLERPFTVVQKKRAEAQGRYRDEISRLQTELEETEKQLSSLQVQKQEGQQFILSPEQKEKILEFRKKEVEARKNLRQVQKDLRREIDSLENRLKWANIAGMPILVSIAGLVIALIHRKRTRAQ